MLFKARDKQWDLSERTLVVGVINATPDSFSDGGECLSPEAAASKAVAFEKAGADILDIGAESTRPGARLITAEEEMERLLPVLKAVFEQTALPVSVDTVKADVAAFALKQGACIVNDVSGLKGDSGMAEVVARFQAGIVIMHRRGDSRTMQQLARYENVVENVLQELEESIDRALKAGISYDRIAVDPGIGFAKTKDQSLSLIKHLGPFRKFERPILIGPSRKSFIGEITGKRTEERLFGTAASVALAVERGARMIRVHDVREMKEVIEVTQAILNAQ